MRIAFCGKGGSGKSTLASLMATYLAAQQKDVLVIDGDINQHLGEALGFSAEMLAAQPKLGMDAALLKKHVKGQNTRIPTLSALTESCPAGRGSGFIFFDQPSPIFDYYQITQNGLRFMALGGHNQSDVGTTCYHKFTGAFGIFLNHLIDDQGDYVIGDMCAGADPFASSGLASRFDVIFLVVEPTLKSTAVYRQCRDYADMFGLSLYVVGNKIETHEDIDFITSKVGTDLVACLQKSAFIRDLEKGIRHPIDQLESENLDTLSTLLSLIDQHQKDWAAYQETGLKFHKAAAEGWINAMLGVDAMDFVDPEFSYLPLLAEKRQKAA